MHHKTGIFLKGEDVVYICGCGTQGTPFSSTQAQSFPEERYYLSFLKRLNSPWKLCYKLLAVAMIRLQK
jgi:hypothetical protein